MTVCMFDTARGSGSLFNMFHTAYLVATLPSATDVAMHVCSAFNLRVREMDWPLCRLALFLDPRFLGLIDPKASVKPLFR